MTEEMEKVVSGAVMACPFCGSQDVAVRNAPVETRNEDGEVRVRSVVMCDNCKARGPVVVARAAVAGDALLDADDEAVIELVRRLTEISSANAAEPWNRLSRIVSRHDETTVEVSAK